MDNEIKQKEQKIGPLPGESIKDYSSRRLVDLENSRKTFIDKINFFRNEVRKTEADLIACDARISEMKFIIESPKSEDPEKP